MPQLGGPGAEGLDLGGEGFGLAAHLGQAAALGQHLPAALHPAAGDGAAGLEQLPLQRDQPGVVGVLAGEGEGGLEALQHQGVAQQGGQGLGVGEADQFAGQAAHAGELRPVAAGPVGGLEQGQGEEGGAAALALEVVHGLLGGALVAGEHPLQPAAQGDLQGQLEALGHLEQVGHHAQHPGDPGVAGLARAFGQVGAALQVGLQALGFGAAGPQVGAEAALLLDHPVELGAELLLAGLEPLAAGLELGECTLQAGALGLQVLLLLLGLAEGGEAGLVGGLGLEEGLVAGLGLAQLALQLGEAGLCLALA